MTTHHHEHIGKKSIVAGLVMLFVLSALAMIGSGPASAAGGPKIVEVWVYEGDSSHPVQGASVTINIWTSYPPSGGQTPRATKTGTTGSNGMYGWTFSLDQWDQGNTIEVIATHTEQRTQTQVANLDFKQTFTFTFPYAIPQLPGILGMLAGATALGVVAVGALRLKKRAN